MEKCKHSKKAKLDKKQKKQTVEGVVWILLL